MFSVDLSTRYCAGHAVVALRGELDIADAADIAAALTVVIAREPEIVQSRLRRWSSAGCGGNRAATPPGKEAGLVAAAC